MRVSLLFLLLFFVSCSNHFSEVSIGSNLQKGDSISVAFYSQGLKQYIPVSGITINESDVLRNQVDISLPDSLIRSDGAFSITIHYCSDTILSISSIQLNERFMLYPEDIMKTLWWQDGLQFQLDNEANTINSRIDKNTPSTFPVGMILFYLPHLKGFQIFLRLSLLATILLLLFLLYRRLATQQQCYR
jgi:hypothetical protein